MVCFWQFLRQCSLCLRNFGPLEEMWPRLLSCGHVYCGPCLSSRIDRDQANLACPFPECPGIMAIDVATPALPLPKHWDVLDAIAAEVPPAPPVMCNCVAEDEPHPASYNCSRCGTDICDLQVLIHTNKKHGGTLTPLLAGQGPMARIVSTICQVHPGKELELFSSWSLFRVRISYGTGFGFR